jgi:hypothetical protein
LGEEELWKKLWKLRVVPRVRTFSWRVLKGFMPDYMTLSRRHIRDDSTCGICKATDEDLKHALVEFSHAKMFWESAKEVLMLKLPRLHPNTWMKDIICKSMIPEYDRAKIISIMYGIWDSLNKWTHGERSFSPTSSMEFVKETLLSVEMPPIQKLPASRVVCRWKMPQAGVVKINSDSALIIGRVEEVLHEIAQVSEERGARSTRIRSSVY